MTKQTALKKVERLENEIAEYVQLMDEIKSYMENCKRQITDLKREYNIGCTLLDESLMDYYKSESRAMALDA
jgi:hypothetical protein